MELTYTGRPDDRWITGFDPQTNTPVQIALTETGVEISAVSLRLLHSFPATASFLRNGWNSWSASAWWQLDQQPWRVWNNPERTATAEDAATDSAKVHRSYMVTALTHEDECLLIGVLNPESAVFDLSTNSVFGRPLELVSQKDSRDFLDNHTLTYFIAAGNEQTCWKNYITALKSAINKWPLNSKTANEKITGKTSARKTAPPTWCSWYSYFEEITQEIIEAEINPAAELGYGALQIDDGWQEQVGHWQANHKFPMGMAHLANQIKAAGLIPGLWLAPFIATEGAEILQTHPEFFIHGVSGRPLPVGYNWGQPYYGLDCTHPGAQKWLTDLLHEVTSWGYQYLKLDFLYAAAFAGHRYADVSRETAYRQGLEIMRAAAPQAYLLGSGAVIAPSLGILDGIRVGPDTAPYWDVQDRRFDPTGPGLRNALRCTIARAWLREIIDVDPDVALCRTRGSLLSPEANEISWDAARVGGVFSCSDPYNWLTENERQAVKALTSTLPLPSDAIQQLDRYKFKILDRVVDFSPWINPTDRMSDRLLVK